MQRRQLELGMRQGGCKPMNLPPVSTVPAPKPGAVKPSDTKAATPGNFPKVDPSTQQQRDLGRRKILEQELANEQRLLDQAKKELAEQESTRLGNERNYQRVLERLEPYKKKVALHEGNIANLRKELSSAALVPDAACPRRVIPGAAQSLSALRRPAGLHLAPDSCRITP